MTNVLRANLRRMFRSKLFWLCNGGTIAVGILNFQGEYRMMLSSGGSSDNSYFLFFTLIGIFLAAFSTLFLGTEYSDGTIRNKLIVGKTRMDIYLASLLTVLLAGLVMAGCYLLVLGTGSYFLMGGFAMPLVPLVWMTLAGLVLVVAEASLLTLLSLLVQSKATAAVMALLLTFALLFGGSFLISRLDEPEMTAGMTMISEGVYASSDDAEPMPNPRYITGFTRDLYQFGADVIPMAQGMQITQQQVEDPMRLMGYSVGLGVLSTGLGIFFFRKKDLK